MKLTRLIVPFALAAGAFFGQNQAAKPEFEVSAVKPSTIAGGQQVSIGLRIDGAQVHIARLSLKEYTQLAYRLKLYQVTGPDWLASEKFDIDAKLPAGATGDQVPEMLQALLADRFQMKLHRASKELAVYGLTVGSGGSKLKESPADTDGEAGDVGKGAVSVAATGGPTGVGINLGKGSYFSFANNRIEGKRLTMVSLADTLTRFLDRPVVDMTGLQGRYDLSIELSPEDYRAMLIRSAVAAGVMLPPQALQLLDGARDDSLFAGMRALGLRLESRKAPVEVLVIDSALKIPTDN